MIYQEKIFTKEECDKIISYQNVYLDLIFRGKVFCTDQPIVSFSVNNGKYVSNSTTNQFIVYE